VALADGERLQLLANAKSREDLVALLTKRGPLVIPSGVHTGPSVLDRFGCGDEPLSPSSNHKGDDTQWQGWPNALGLSCDISSGILSGR